MAQSVITMDGHILDSLLLPKVLDLIVSQGAEYEIEEIKIGRTRHDSSHVRLRVTADDSEELRGLITLCVEHGAREC